MLTLGRDVYDDIVAHARADTPQEVCGILAGEFDDEASVSIESHRTVNTASDSQTEYAIDPEEQFAVMGTIERENHDVVGFYHSHPQGPPAPSPTDQKRATWDGYSYVIVALGGTHPYVGSWRWTGEEFEQELLAID